MTKHLLPEIIVIAILCIVFFPSALAGQNNVSIGFTPSVSFPLADSADFYGIGGGGDITVNVPVSSIPSLSLKGGLGYNFLPVQAEIALNEFSLTAGAGYELQLFPLLTLFADAGGGYYVGILPLKTGTSSIGTGFLLEGGGGVQLNFSPGINLRLGVSYKHDFDLYNGVKVYLTAGLRQGKSTPGKANIEIQQIDIQRIFPVFYKYYDANSLGSITVKNIEPGAIKDLAVSFYVNQYMERPKLSTQLVQVNAGETVTVPLFGLFKDGVFNLYEETAVSGEIAIKYELNGEDRVLSIPQTVYIANRNSITWDDDKKAAAFVQSKDPGVIKFGRNIANTVKSTGNAAFNEQFRIAAGIFIALKDMGITYIPDPTTPYIKLSADEKSIDYLQFPWQTIEYKSGDCDDLSILYTSLLESAGIEAGFITVPGHIYSAFATGLAESDTKRLFAKTDAFIFHEGKTWLPVETTMLSQGFEAAWKDGARQWREHSPAKKALLIPIRKAWELYNPVGYRSNADKDFPAPAVSVVAGEFNAFIASFTENEIKVQEAASRSLYKPGSPEALNWLGILNYRMGKSAKAKAIFDQILEANSKYVPSLVNLGNIAFLEGNYTRAEEIYQKANNAKPGNPGVLMAIAKTHYELERFDSAKELYQKVAQGNPELAKQNAYIVSGSSEIGRASDQVQKSEDMVWINQ